MLTESYEDRLANLQKEFGDTVVTDLDEKHKREDAEEDRDLDQEGLEKSRHSSNTTASSSTAGGSASSSAPVTRINSPAPSRLSSSNQTNSVKAVPSPSITMAKVDQSNVRASPSPKDLPNDCLPHTKTSLGSSQSRWSLQSGKSASAPTSTSITPLPTPNKSDPVTPNPSHLSNTTTRHSRGKSS